ncbi:ABC transporter ATP-binding protein [Camelimonas lactis]|uniref:Branched-chain amino acid transport system ATP-binding protein n=1 Tax=Camelimonas lactis TaxID=659006 RepID=A0A4R2GY59_9HYPH|nr:ABC transporter ATP-binding protein [Camelimonas lactis]TCO15987.1 branched-chain amino acid transport system ATP-binding protein [Camelimonas lactis]
MSAPPLLTATGLARAWGGVRAVDDVSFSVAAGEIVALIGPNGAGKSTCFNLINGQLQPDAGRVLLSGRDITGAGPARAFRAGVGRTFQIAATFASMTVRENVQTALAAGRGQIMRPWGAGRNVARDDAMRLLALSGMAAQAERPAAELAYGDVKRLELAIALAGAPRLLLMDEPTAGMAPADRADLMRTAVAVARKQNIGVLFTEHDMDAVFAHADRILVLDRGRLIASGAPADVRDNAAVRAAYLGDGVLFAATSGPHPGDPKSS